MNISIDFLQEEYPVFTGKDALFRFEEYFRSKHPFSKVFVLCDTNTAEFCYPSLLPFLKSNWKVTIFVIDAGENSKSVSSCEQIWTKLDELNFTKSDLMINLGGGVISDLGGFVASTYLRGIKYINMPTSLMAMVDAGIGGKNGVNFRFAKNRMGTIYFPICTVCDTSFLETLPNVEWVNGTAEVFKHALIRDADLWKELSAQGCTRELLPELLTRIQEIKLKIVQNDPFENGERKILNYGHTIGHAIEACSLQKDVNPLSHGEAIAMGMIIENEIACLMGLMKQETKSYVRTVLEKYILAVNIENYQPEEILSRVKQDKKNANGKILMSLISDIASCKYDVEVEEELMLKVMKGFV